MAEPAKGGDANAFIQEYGPIAQRIGQQLNVDPRIILAQFGMETGWGKSVVPGTYNLGNIKSAGKGVEATDNVTKTKDRYLKFEDPEVFADYYADYMKRQFPEVVGAGADVNAFTKALRPGQKGGYAEDTEYGSKLGNAFSLVSNRIESQPEENPFGSGPTEAQRISEEPEPAPVSRETVTNKEDAALVGAGVGLGAGVVAQATKPPSNAKYDAAMERLRAAEDKLVQARASGVSGNALADLENELKMRQSVAMQAADELKAAEAELRAASKVTPPAAPAAPASPFGAVDDAAAASRKVPGSSGAANWVRAMGQDVPDVIAETAENMRKDNPRGGQAIIDRDVAAKQKIKDIGAGDYRLTGQGKSQLMLPPDLSVERTAALDTELAQRQAQEAAERTRLAQESEAKRIAAEKRVEAARQARRQAGTAVGEQSQAVRDARQAQKAVDRAQAGVNVAEARVARTPAGPQGGLQKLGAATAKVAPKALGVISGAATGLSAMEAIEKFKAGDYSGAVLPTLEATFGVMSMLPPAHPVLLALRGLGTAGGAALAGYEGYKAIKGEPQPQE